MLRDHVPYDTWEQQGFIKTTKGNVVHYGFIETFIEQFGVNYNIREIAFDRWGAVQMSQNLAITELGIHDSSGKLFFIFLPKEH